MIDVKDFRIGNLILIDEKPCRINLLNNDQGFSETPCIGYSSKDDNGYERCSSNRIQPLPVTQEWINRFQSGMNDHLKIATRSFDPADVSIHLDFSDKPFLRSIKYIHSLQNLYFVLAGEELHGEW
jgi:hypothetical protein